MQPAFDTGKERLLDTMKKLYIEPTSNCNLDCSMCFRNNWIDEVFADMGEEVFRAALDTMPETVETIFFGGMGEPLAHPRIIDMIREAVATGRRVEMVTNVALLKPEMSEKLIASGLHRLWVSVDAFNEEGYNAIRRNGSFTALRSNLYEFNRIKRERNAAIGLGVNFVAMKTNVDQLRYIPAFIIEFKVNEVNISNLIPSDRESEELALYSDIVGVNEVPTSIETVPINLPLMDWREEKVLTSIMSLVAAPVGVVNLSGQRLIRKYNHCRFIDEGIAFVRHDGAVSPCMALLHSAKNYWLGWERVVRHHAFGNVLWDGLGDIWNSPAYAAFRERVRAFDFAPCMRCSGCDNWEENETDCFGNDKPVCGACLWAEGVISCP